MIVLKIGGSVFERGLTSSLIEDVNNTMKTSPIVIVHGGGAEVTKIAEKLGKKQRFITSPGGIRSRYTDEETIKIYAMVMAGKINKEIVALLQRRRIPSVGLSGIDAMILKAKRKKRLIIVDERGRKRIIDGGYTGKISEVDDRIIKLLVEKGYVPVVSSIALSEEYELLNVDSDRAAANIAGALEASKIIFLTDVDGLSMEGEFVEKLSIDEAETLLSRMGPGMDKKVMASVEALKMGVREAIITSGLIDKPITEATNHYVGTVITRE